MKPQGLRLFQVLGTVLASWQSSPRLEAQALSSPASSQVATTDLMPVLNGIDVLARQNFAPLKGLRIGLISNQTGVDRARRSTIDLLHDAHGVTLRALFSPEHGIRGTLDAAVSDSVDAKTGLPIYSLY